MEKHKNVERLIKMIEEKKKKRNSKKISKVKKVTKKDFGFMIYSMIGNFYIFE